MVKTLQERLIRSAVTVDSSVTLLADFQRWFRERADADESRVEIIPFEQMRGWAFAPDTHNLVHETGRFFSVEGLPGGVGRAPRGGLGPPHTPHPPKGLHRLAVKEIK
ncbi:NDP-hexose 2,3-dehydratase family protein, partial [Streptomyces sp. NPDC127074]|uniref:NDP-hexose 2,3-dehydratase family protein n=1 Tax=Streptomyces sp. NPDC127074 TaxID=3347130 RepID=UPI00364B77C9